MLSAVQDEHRGYDFPITGEELARLNEFRGRLCRPPLTELPGIWFLEFGKNTGWVLGQRTVRGSSRRARRRRGGAQPE